MTSQGDAEGDGVVKLLWCLFVHFWLYIYDDFECVGEVLGVLGLWSVG